MVSKAVVGVKTFFRKSTLASVHAVLSDATRLCVCAHALVSRTGVALAHMRPRNTFNHFPRTETIHEFYSILPNHPSTPSKTSFLLGS